MPREPRTRGFARWLLTAAGVTIVLFPLLPRAGESSSSTTALARIDSLWEAGAGLAARADIEREIAGARAGADSLFLLNLLYRDGRLLAALNRSLEAEPVLLEGMRLAGTLRESLLYRACLRWLGVALIGRGRLREVATRYNELLRLSRSSGDAQHEGYAWMGLAYCDWQNGEPRDAREKYARSIRIFREIGDARGELWALIGLNNALTMLGAYDEAIAGHRRIVAMGKAMGSPEIEALGHNNLGVLLFSLGDTGEALSHFLDAASLQERNGNARESIIAGQNACICEIVLGRTSDAAARLRSLLDASRENGYADVETGLLTELAYAHLQQGQHRAAARLFREALGLREGLVPKREAEAITGLSTALARMDSSDAALSLLRVSSRRVLALDDARIQLAFRNEMADRLLDRGLAGDALETAMIVERRGATLGLSALRLEALPLAARAAVALGRPDTALALLRRGAVLWEKDRGLPLDPEWREQRGAAAKSLFTQLAWLTLRHPPSDSREERVGRSFDALQTYKARTLIERMKGPGGETVPVVGAVPATLEEMRSNVLRPGELLLDFTIGEKHSLLYACTREECRAIELPGEAELDRRARSLHEILSSPPNGESPRQDIEAIAASAARLAETLFASCADMIDGASSVIVVPDGALNLLPFSYLLAAGGRLENGAAGGAHAVGTRAIHAVSRVPAAAVLVELRRGADRSDGEPAFPGSVLAVAGGRTNSGKPLPGTKRETAMLAGRYAEVTRRPPRTTDDLAGFDVLHFAGHSTIDDQAPWRSAIHLVPGPDTAGAQPLTASRIAACRLPARLAVLSSCESAGGRFLSGQGVLGLTSAFLSAGVPSVLASLWPVDDRVAAEFMTAFYDALRNGRSAAGALLEAQERIRRRPGEAHPFYWAGFVLTGEGDLRVPIRPAPRAWLWWWIAALIPAAAWLGLRCRAKKAVDSGD